VVAVEVIGHGADGASHALVTYGEGRCLGQLMRGGAAGSGQATRSKEETSKEDENKREGR
jgi:hypothetical protein